MAIALYFFNNYSSNLSFRKTRSIKKMNLALIGGKHEIHGVADQINLIMRMT